LAKLLTLLSIDRLLSVSVVTSDYVPVEVPRPESDSLLNPILLHSQVFSVLLCVPKSLVRIPNLGCILNSTLQILENRVGDVGGEFLEWDSRFIWKFLEWLRHCSDLIVVMGQEEETVTGVPE
jgi:hypothetical protein